jgi:Fe-S-cluster-containing hydrogenase component 2
MPHVMISAKKCTGCHMCELGCSAWHEGGFQPSRARLFAEVNPTTAVIKGHSCLQTGCAKCEEACPNGAIVRRTLTVTPVGDFASKEKVGESVTGVVLAVDEDKCTNCGDCYDACPYGVINEHPDRKVAFKCDLCDGDPQCIAFCQNQYVLAVDLKVDKADRALTVEV